MINFDKINKFSDNVPKNFEIISGQTTLTNADIYSESIEIKESLCSDEHLMFSAEASSIRFKTRYEVDLAEKIEVKVTVDGSTLPVGTYFIDTNTPSGARDYRDITAYDLMYKINSTDFAEWYISKFRAGFFPCTINEFFNAFLAEINRLFNLNISVDVPIITNGTFVYQNAIYEEGATLELPGARILGDLANATASFIRINRDGNFEFLQIHEGIPIREYGLEDYSTCIHEDYLTKKVSKVQIIKEDGDFGVSSGSDGNTYTISGNFLLHSVDVPALQGACDRIFNIIKNIEYTPFTMQTQGNPCYEVGDFIKFTSHGAAHKSFILQRTLKGIQSLRDTLSAEGTEEISETDNDIRNQVQLLNGKSNVLKTDLEHTISQLTDLDRDVNTRFEQTADSITLQVSAETTRAMSVEEILDGKYLSLQQQLNGEQKVYNTDYVPTLLNYPAWDFTYNIPCNDTVQLRDDLMFEYTDEYYNKNARSTVFNSADSTTYRFTKDTESGVWYWKPVADSDFGIVMQQLAELKVSVDGISSTVSRDYLKILDAQGTYETIEHVASSIQQTEEKITTEVTRAKGVEESLSTSITQTADEIRLEVSSGYATKGSLELKVSKDDNDQIVSMLNASADQINIEGNRIKIQSNSFSLDYDGNIVANSGVVGGWNINGSEIYHNTQNGKVSMQADGTIVCYSNGNPVWALQNDGVVLMPGYATVNELDATNLVVSGKASIQDLESVSARIGTIEANYITAQTVSANYATIGNLNAQTARIDSLVTATSNPNQGIITTGTMRCGNVLVYDGETNSYKTYSRHSITVNGVRMWALLSTS